MSARSLADARNRELINTALRSNPLILQAQKTGQLTNDIATSIGLNVSKKAGTNIVQSTLGKSGLGAKAIAAAQALSEKFGIVTFDVEGNIATVPETRDIDPTIFVGTGRFTDSAFKKSIQVLQGKSDPIATFGDTVNETILKPIIKGFTDLFGSRNIADLPEEQQIRVKDIDTMLEMLKAQLKPVPPCKYVEDRSFYLSGLRQSRGHEDCSEKSAAVAFNETIHAQIDILESEREGIFKFYVVLAGFEKKVIDQAEILTRLVKENPLTATLKAEIGAEIQTASALLQEIISKQIEVSNEDMKRLQLAMNAGAARMSEQVSGSANVLDQLGTNLVNNITGVGGLLDDLGGIIDAITKGIASSFDKIFNPSVEDILEKQKKMHEYQITEYAKFIEESQRFLARGIKK